MSDNIENIPQEENEDMTLSKALESELKATPWYIGSLAIHALVFLFILLIPPTEAQAAKQKIIISPIMSEIQDLREEEIAKPDIEERPNLTNDTTDDISTEQPIITTTDVEISDHNETDDNIDDNTARGESDLNSNFDSEDRGSPAFMGVGNGGGSGGGGRFGNRNGGGKRNLVARGGGGGTTSILDSGLRWLAEHQETDGHWDCRAHEATSHDVGNGNDIGVTSLALLAFLGNGNSNHFGKYKDNVGRATQWLIGQMKPTGEVGFHRYQSGIAIMALSEAYGMGDKAIRSKAQLAVDWAVSSQNATGGWDYAPNSPRTDTSVTGWWVMGIKSARVAGLTVPSEVFDKALDYIQKATTDEGQASYCSTNGGVISGGGSNRMIAVPLVCLQFLGIPRDNAKVIAAAKRTLNDLPTMNYDFYLMYYQALGLFQMGIKSDYWKQFNPAMKNVLLNSQVKVGTYQENKGSWNPDIDPWGKAWGRVGQTALGSLMLEVYFRYYEVEKLMSKQKK